MSSAGIAPQQRERCKLPGSVLIVTERCAAGTRKEKARGFLHCGSPAAAPSFYSSVEMGRGGERWVPPEAVSGALLRTALRGALRVTPPHCATRRSSAPTQMGGGRPARPHGRGAAGPDNRPPRPRALFPRVRAAAARERVVGT